MISLFVDNATKNSVMRDFMQTNRATIDGAVITNRICNSLEDEFYSVFIMYCLRNTKHNL